MSQAPTSEYTIVDLGALDPLFGVALNNRGQACVSFTFGGARLWDAGVVQNIEVPDGYQTVIASDLNDSAVVVGVCGRGKDIPHGWDLFDRRASVWNQGLLQLIEVEGSTESWAAGTNNRGDVVGTLLRRKGASQAFLRSADGETHILPGLPGCSGGWALAINEHGDVAGAYGTLRLSRACLWKDGQVLDLGTPGGGSSSALAVNEQGDVVGVFHTEKEDSRYPFLYRDGHTHRLGSLGGSFGMARDLNNLGQVVGYSAIASRRSHAFLWQGGRMMDLNEHVPAESGWVLHDAYSINDAGQIAGTGWYHDKPRGFLLTPV